MPPRRFVFVPPRYASAAPGARPVLGGGEAHCRAVAERLGARGHDVRVLTTTASSYHTWRNELPDGDEVVSTVRVTRFRTSAPRLFPLDEMLKALCTRMRKGREGLRRLRSYDASSEVARRADDALQHLWIRAQGPIVPGLVDAVARADADLVVFFGYLYYPTIFGLPRAAARAALVPLGDEEPMLYAPIVRSAMRSARAILANTEPEAERLHAIVHTAAAATPPPPTAVVALGVDEPPPPQPGRAAPISAPYILVLGRAGKAKPMAALFRELVERRDLGVIELDDGRRVAASELHLITAGEISTDLQGLPRVVQLGQVDDDVRWALIRGALALVSPSATESLALVVLEAWLAGRPVVVNRACDVTDAHVRLSSGGASIDFGDPQSAADALVAAIASRSARAACAARGGAYVRSRYRWEPVVEAYETVADAVASGGDVRTGLAAWAGRHGAWMR
jgi:glycosyltransferase involved in cell wall biosynthesis